MLSNIYMKEALGRASNCQRWFLLAFEDKMLASDHNHGEDEPKNPEAMALIVFAI